MATTDTVTLAVRLSDSETLPCNMCWFHASPSCAARTFTRNTTREALFSLLNQIKSHPRLFSLCFCPLWDAKVLVSKRFHLSLSRVSRCGSFFFWEDTPSLRWTQQTLSGFDNNPVTPRSLRKVFTASSTNRCPQTEHFWPVSSSRLFKKKNKHINCDNIPVVSVLTFTSF